MIRDVWAQLRSLLPAPKRQLTEVVVLSAAGSILEAVVLVIVARAGIAIDGSATDVGVAGISLSLLTWVLVACGALVLLVVTHALFSAAAAKLSGSVLTAARRRLAQAFVEADYQRQTKDADGTLQHAATTLAEQSAYVALTFTVGIASAINVLIMVVGSAAVSPLATLGVGVIGALLFAALRPIARITRRSATRFVDSNARFGSLIAEQSKIALETRTFGVERERTAILERQSVEVGSELQRSRMISLVGGFLFRDLALLLLLGGLAALIVSDQVSIASLGPVLLLNVRAVSFAQGVQSTRQVLSEHSPNLAALTSLISSYEGHLAGHGHTKLDHIGPIELSAVSFAYPGSAATAIDGIDITIEPGGSVALVGPSGGGKTTLAHLLLRLRRPTEGSITVSGVPIEEISQGDWNRLVALVPQHPRLVDDTVEENVRFYRRDIADAQVVQALEDAAVLGEVQALRDGISTQVGAAGVGLSGGQQQRLTIARALAGRPELIVFDEPTSALDETAEGAIAGTIRALKGRVTLIVIAHRPATIEACDTVFEVRSGRILRLR